MSLNEWMVYARACDCSVTVVFSMVFPSVSEYGEWIQNVMVRRAKNKSMLCPLRCVGCDLERLQPPTHDGTPTSIDVG